jgi:ATP adenylyltransferase
LKQLWAPWRNEYIQNADKVKDCILCFKPRTKPDEENLILWLGRYAFVMMNRYPYNSGHLMIAPRRHIAAVERLTRAESGELFALLQQAILILKQEYEPHGFNVGLNLGRVAGAGVEDHLHIHVVPRWNGDTNFMPVTGQAKVISEHLMAGYRRLRPHFDRIRMQESQETQERRRKRNMPASSKFKIRSSNKPQSSNQ